jgi:hypothetical protein
MRLKINRCSGINGSINNHAQLFMTLCIILTLGNIFCLKIALYASIGVFEI